MKTQMQIFEQAALEAALAEGCQSAELYTVETESFEAGVLEGKLDSYSAAETRTVCLRVQQEGRSGIARTEVLEEPEMLAYRAAENAALSEAGDPEPLQGPCVYPAVQRQDCPLQALSEREKIQLALRMEEIARQSDPRFLRVAASEVYTAQGRIRLRNTLGLEASHPIQGGGLALEALLQEQGELREGYAVRHGALAADAEGCAREAVAEAAATCGAAPVPAGTYRVLLRRDAASSLLGAFFSLFSGEAALRNLTPLADRLGETIAAHTVTLTDDPFAPWDPVPFDGEGVPAQATTVIRQGVLTTLLHNLKTARKAGVASTGNAGRAGGRVTVSPSHLILQPGRLTLEELEARMGDGLLITQVSGLHAGVNAASGEFSLLCKGFLLRHGRRVQPVSQCTVGGNFLDLLRQVEAVGADQNVLYTGGGSVTSPSLLLSGLVIGGKNADH